MKWLSVLALCAALFIAATHASQLQDEGMMDRAAEEKLLQMLLADQANTEADIEDKMKLTDEETAVYKGRINTTQGKARSSQCDCCHRRGSVRWQK